MKPDDDLDFEIAFYEGILKEKPEYVDGLIALGDTYSKKGRYEDGLKVDLTLVKLKPDDPVVHYNLACDYSLLKMTDASLGALEKAMQLGYQDFAFMEMDPDLQFIRQDLRYQRLLSKYKQKSSYQKRSQET